MIRIKVLKETLASKLTFKASTSYSGRKRYNRLEKKKERFSNLGYVPITLLQEYIRMNLRAEFGSILGMSKISNYTVDLKNFPELMDAWNSAEEVFNLQDGE